MGLHSGPQMAEWTSIADLVADGHHDQVLDWGCGLGQITRMLVDRGVRVVAMDVYGATPNDGTVTTRPMERYPDIDVTLTAEPVVLPFDDGAFDAVLSVGVLEHVPEAEASLDEVRRVLRVGGTFYCFKLPNRTSYLERIARTVGMYYHGAHADDRVYSLASAVALVERHGFDVVDGRYMNMLPLTLSGERFARLTGPWMGANAVISRAPGLRRLATNVELVAIRR